MYAGFWKERWALREIGFHQGQFHPFLTRFFPELGLPAGSRVLVPLCGKSLDMIWLRDQGFQVIGAELIPTAVEEFFQEQNLQPVVEKSVPGLCYRSESLEIHLSDFFALTKREVGQIDAVYDRGSLVAFPAKMRGKYVQQLLGLVSPPCQQLLVSYDYPQQQMAGPPFSVPRQELEALFQPDWSLSLLHREESLERHKKMQSSGLMELREEAYRLKRLAS